MVIEVDDVEKAVAFYKDVFNLEQMDEGEGDTFFKLVEQQFLTMFEVDQLQPDRMRHFGILVRDEAQLKDVREKVSTEYGCKQARGSIGWPGVDLDYRTSMNASRSALICSACVVGIPCG